MRSWQQGDAAAFTELVRRWQQPIARFLMHATGRRELTADLCQEVFLRVYRSGATYRRRGKFSTWLYRIAVNVARDAGRKHRARPDWHAGEAGPVNDACSAVPDERAINPDAACQRQELAGIVARILAELPDEQRVPLVLRHYEGLSFEEIARLQGLAASTVKSRFAAGLKRLQRRLEERGLGPEEVSL